MELSPERPAPGALDLVRRFVNTQDLAPGTDELADRERYEGWCHREGLLERNGRCTETSFHRALALRAALRECLLAHAERSPEAPEALASINELARLTRTEATLATDAKLALEHRARPADAPVGELLVRTFRAAHDGTWPRLKACSAHDCEWGFYDTSRNASSRWCSMELCGNRAKASALRGRRMATASPPRNSTS